jgi:hypothetical protein
MSPSNLQSGSLPSYVPVMEMIGACTMTQISGFISSCVAGGSTQSNCAMWANGNSACAGCIVQGGDAGATQTGAIIFDANGHPVSGNVPGCIALEDSMGGPACANDLEPLMQCVAAACPNCPDQTTFDNCEKAAKSTGGVCATLSSAVGSSCAADLGSNGVGLSKCGYGSSNQLTDVINVICGSGP